MLEALKFVKGAVAKKDFIPALTHFLIKDGVIKGYNGSIALCSPIDLDITAVPRAIPFIKAIETCRETVGITITNAGRLAIKAGAFKAFVECVEDSVFPEIEPEGERIELENGFLDKLKKLAPFIAQDASRPWATGILFRGASAYVTNNIILVEQWLGYNFPAEVNIPSSAVKELLRIKKEPTAIQLSENSITFLFEDGQWLRSQLFDIGWPDMSSILDRESNQEKVPEGFFQALDDLSSFVGEMGSIHFLDGAMTTRLDAGNGATVTLEGIKEGAIFHIDPLSALRDIVSTIDFSMYPKPCLFYGEELRGVIIGKRG